MQAPYAAAYARLYREHWWWRSREAILLDLIRSLGLPPGGEILDVGCGDGLFFPELERFGRVRGIEVDAGLLDPDGPYRDRISTLPLGDPSYEADAGRFGLITALDVIEHIADDGAAVRAMAAMLRPGGLLIVTVPAFPALWDHHDEINLHHRRYTAATLRRTLDVPGLELIRLRYLYPGLFPPKYLVARVNRRRASKLEQHALPAPWANRLLARLCLIEDRILRRLPVPFGTSALAVARRVGPDA
ncbi:class I SAM-dependent methyltransferase [Tundrisphaera sp. TA3]|uniref:class I SAM-dependent methyltransferase n=1 Tax=Tundrisphaera sp. TA3 TaxID=3435775 RepID=UPI003EB914E8